MAKTKIRAKANKRTPPAPSVQKQPEKKGGPLPAMRASDLMMAAEPNTGAPGRARMMTDLQRAAGNTRISRLLDTPVQTKLTVGPVGDKYEQEAERVSAKVMKMPQEESTAADEGRMPATSTTGVAQRQIESMEREDEEQATPGSVVDVQRQQPADEARVMAQPADEDKMPATSRTDAAQRQIESMEQEDEERTPPGPVANVQRQESADEGRMMAQPADEEVRRQETAEEGESTTAAGPAVEPDTEQEIQAARGAGQRLPGGVRRQMEGKFGADFGGVNIHSDAQSDKLNRTLGSRAFTAGPDVFFKRGEYEPGNSKGQQLLAHELTHVKQQTGTNGRLVRTKSELRIARAKLDLGRLDQELRAGGALTRSHGEIGQATAAGRLTDPPTPDSSVSPVSAYVYKRTPPSPPATPARGGASGTGMPAATPTPPTSPDAGVPPATPEIRDAGVPLPAGVPPAAPAPTPSPTPTPTPAQPPAQRAFIVGGIHGDERGPQAIMTRLQAQLGSPTAPLRRDFDTIVVPVMNPGGVADRTRENRRGVDLNRNFPGLTGYPAPSGPVAPEQLETAAVRRVIETLQPSRILALHAITNRGHGGVYADPVEGEARELACRMALRMRGSQTRRGMSGEINVRGNQVARGVCEARYPGAPPSVTSAQSSLGAWASAPTSIGGRGTTVITHEVAGKQALPEHGAGRSVDTIMPGIEEFLLDNGGSASEADALLQGAVTDAFLTGKAATAADRRLRSTIQGIVRRRFDDMAKYYRTVWRPAQPAATRRHLPRRLTRHSHVRTFRSQAGIVAGQLGSRGINRRSSVADIQNAIQDILQTRSMPGFSRHHWGTEIDVLSADRTLWQGRSRRGAFVDVIPFLNTEARNFGFFHPYTASVPRPTDPHYQAEPWHISYWPIANVLQQEWASRFTGAALNLLISETARTIARRRGIPQRNMESALGAIGLEHYQTNVAPSP